MYRLYLVLLSLAKVITSEVEDPCLTKNVINDWTRSVAYKDTHSRCDSDLQPGWYIITSKAGSEMPTQCPNGGLQCGTMFPMYLSAVHSNVTPETLYPEPGQPVDRTVCSASYSGNCCQEKLTIQIKNCGTYFVYNLNSTESCPTAYCFGTNRPCPVGESSETGFTPGCGTYKNETVTPTVTTGLYQINGTSKDKIEMTYSTVKFECHVNVESQYTYDVRWYIDDIEIYEAAHINQSAIGLSNSTMLHQNMWESRFKPNMWVKCSVQIRDINFSAPSPLTYSEPFFAGVVVDQKTNILKEGVSIDIPVHLTIPVGCNFPADGDNFQTIIELACFVNIVATTYSYKTNSNGCEKGDINFHKCGVSFVFKQKNWTTSQNLTIIGATDNKINFDDRIAILQLHNEERSSSSAAELNIWKGIMLEQLTFIVVDTDIVTSGKWCQSNNDPHMVTFDGRHYELHTTTGEYVMYKHERLPIRIHSFFQRCRSALCNCGVAVRSEDSVFIVDFCSQNARVVEKKCEENDMQISSWNSNGYIIDVPSGAQIQIMLGNAWGAYIITHFHIRSSELDLNGTRGLCGVFNNDRNDDFRMPNGIDANNAITFAESWRIKQNNGSLFNNEKLEPLYTKAPEFCSCLNADITSSNISREILCNITMNQCREINDHTWSYKKPCRQNHQRRQTREAEMIPDEEPEFYLLELNDPNPKEPDMSWKNGWTELKALDHCNSAFNSTPVQDLCAIHVPVIKADDFISNCVFDIQITGDTEWVDASIYNFVSNCISEAGRMEILTMSNSTNGTEAEQRSIFEIIASISCPRNCSGNGICSKAGTCNCTENYFGDDCSLPVTMAPIIAKEKFSGVCDTSERPCNLYIIPGMYFTNVNMTCRFRPFLIDYNSTIDEGIIEEEAGIYQGIFLMHCKAPLTRYKRAAQNSKLPGGFYLSVSNDGLNFTEEVQLLVYNKLCYNCNKTTLICTEIATCPENRVPLVNVYVNSDKTTPLVAGICSGILLVCIFAVIVALSKAQKGTRVEVLKTECSQENLFIKR